MGHSTNQECLQTANEATDLERKLDEARKKNQDELAKSKKLRSDFNKMRDDYYNSIDGFRQKLRQQNMTREDAQQDAQRTELDLFDAKKINKELLEEVFQKEVEKQQLQNKQKQADQNIKLLEDRKKDLEKQTTLAQRSQ